jgi:ATP-dependent DNA helicase RecQ
VACKDRVFLVGVSAFSHAVTCREGEEEEPITQIARERFGVPYLFPYQRLVIANTLESDSPRRQLVVLPTGAGKSLCFQLPALLLDGPTVAIFPLRSLMADQKRRATELGLNPGVLQGGQSSQERRQTFRAVESGESALLITNPETLRTASVVSRLQRARPAHLVIDEAHCVIEWGKTFRPSYLHLANTIDLLRPQVVTAFTATASSEMLPDIRKALFGTTPANEIVGNPDRPNIAYSVVKTLSRCHALRELVGDSRDSGALMKPAIVFCRSRAQTEAIAREIGRWIGWDRVGAYHAGLLPQERERIERWFFGSSDGVLAATCAYGLGIDKKDIRTTIHFDLPPSIEAFLQESGRSGRDGASAESVVIDHGSTRPLQEAVTASDVVAQRRQEVMVEFCRSSGCRRENLMIALGAEPCGCSGCDRCRVTRNQLEPVQVGRARLADAEVRQAIVSWVARNARQHTVESTAWRLSRHLPAPDRPRCIDSWTHTEIRESLLSLVGDGTLRICGHGPWRFNLTPNRGGTIVEP